MTASWVPLTTSAKCWRTRSASARSLRSRTNPVKTGGPAPLMRVTVSSTEISEPSLRIAGSSTRRSITVPCPVSRY